MYNRNLHILNESEDYQYYLDYRTGCATAITGRFNSERLRAACSALNTARTLGIKEAARITPAGESVPLDVWTTSFKRVSSQWQLPVVSLDKLSIFCDGDGILTSSELEKLPSGAEAEPYLDPVESVVYKLFDLRIDGSLGKKVAFESNSEGEMELVLKSAILTDTLEKLSILDDAGAHPTEIIGLSEDGFYLLAKQPLAYPMKSFHEDRDQSLKLIQAVLPTGGNFRSTVAIIWLHNQSWIIADLHDRNIMIDANGNPTIIDALIGAIPPLASSACYFLNMAIHDAKEWKDTGQQPLHSPFEDVPDDDL